MRSAVALHPHRCAGGRLRAVHGAPAVTHGHAVISLRMLGVSVKHFTLDMAYAGMQYPAELPQRIPRQ